MSISVIIPVYNSEIYLHKCIDSVIRAINTETDEIIIVYDKSDDRSIDVISEYADRYYFITLLSGGGKGCGSARNIGLRAASNEYIAFVDADDSISSEFKYKDVDLNGDVICLDFLFENNNSIIKTIFNNLCSLSKDKSVFYNFAITGEFATVVWNKIYRRDFLFSNYIIFEDIPEWEDVVFSAKVASLLSFDNFRVYNILYYRALVRNDSRSRNVNIELIAKAVVALRIAYDFFAVNNLEQARLFKLYSIRHLNYFALKCLSRSDTQKVLNIDHFEYNIFRLFITSELPLHHKVIYTLRQSRFGLAILKLLSFFYAERVSL